MRHFKMILYGEPGVGKSTFAIKSPNPFFITTDGNYEFLEDFGAKEEAHIQVKNWKECLKAFSQPYDEYDTIVVDLLEDTFKMCENDFCIEKKIDHVSDLGYGKGYDISRNNFYAAMMKLLGREDKNIILIMHGITSVLKDRRGVEHTIYAPTNRLPDKVADVLEGAVRYCLRCYIKNELVGDKSVKKRYLKLIPEEGEFGIARGLDETKVPTDIPLDFDTFARLIGLEGYVDGKKVKKVKEVKEVKKVQEEVTKDVVEEPVKETSSKKDLIEESLKRLNKKKEDKKEVVEKPSVKTEADEKPVENTSVTEESSTSQPLSPTTSTDGGLNANDKLAAIRAKIAALKAAKK